MRKIPGIGRVAERLLDSIGIKVNSNPCSNCSFNRAHTTKTCGDVFTHRAVLLLMDKEFGMRSLFNAYLGIGSNVVEPWARGERKSIGAERCVQMN